MPMSSPRKPDGAEIWCYEENCLPEHAKSPAETMHHVMNQ